MIVADRHFQDAPEMIGCGVTGDGLSGIPRRGSSHIAGYERFVEFPSLLAPVTGIEAVSLNVWLRRVRCSISGHPGIAAEGRRRGAPSSAAVLIVRSRAMLM